MSTVGKVGRWVDVITQILGVGGAIRDDAQQVKAWRALMAAIDNLESAVNDLSAKVDVVLDKLAKAAQNEARIQASAEAVAAQAKRLGDA